MNEVPTMALERAVEAIFFLFCVLGDKVEIFEDYGLWKWRGERLKGENFLVRILSTTWRLFCGSMDYRLCVL
jgi:hypothetical protein